MYKSEDKNVEAVRQKLLERSQVGLSKYGVTTERTDIDLVGWMNHAQEEAMDFAIYLEAAMQSHSDIATLEQENRQMRTRMERLESELAGVVSAGRNVIARWESPLWKDLTHTGDYIHALRLAIAAVQP